MNKGIFDTHTHFNDEWYLKEGIEISDIISRAEKVGVKYFCNIGFDLKSSKRAVSQASLFKNVYAAVGVHPNEAHKIDVIDLEEIEQLANSDRVVAIGEVGLDYYKTDEHKEVQKEMFGRQIDIALKFDLALDMHIRDKDGKKDAYLDALKILKEKKVKKAIVHCFTQGYELAELFINEGYLISIPGIVTFKNSTALQDAVRKISLNSLLVETDAPYLTPEPLRGKINTSEFISYTVKKIAELKKMDVEDIISATETNAKAIFGIPTK